MLCYFLVSALNEPLPTLFVGFSITYDPFGPGTQPGEIIVLRGQGTQQKAMAFRYNDVVRGRSLDTNIELLSGDIVVVP